MLERRLLLSTTPPEGITLADGWLRIVGSDGSDRVELVVHAEQIVATLATPSATTTVTADRSAARNISLILGADDDAVAARLAPGQLLTPTPLPFTTIDAGGGNDTIDWEAPGMAPINVIGGDGDDRFIDRMPRRADGVISSAFVGGPGADDTYEFHGSDLYDDQIVLDAAPSKRTITGSRLAAIGDAEAVVLDAHGRNDAVVVNDLQTRATILGGDGSDHVTIAGSGTGNVTIDTAGGSDTAVFHHGAAGAISYDAGDDPYGHDAVVLEGVGELTLRDGLIQTSPFSLHQWTLSHQGVDSMSLLGSMWGQENVKIQTSDDIPIHIRGQGGYDYFFIDAPSAEITITGGPQRTNISLSRGSVTFDGGVNDQPGTLDVAEVVGTDADELITITADTITSPLATLRYVTAIATVRAGGGNDVVRIDGTTAGFDARVYGDAGDDTVQATGAGESMEIHLHGGDGTNTLENGLTGNNRWRDHAVDGMRNIHITGGGTMSFDRGTSPTRIVPAFFRILHGALVLDHVSQIRELDLRAGTSAVIHGSNPMTMRAKDLFIEPGATFDIGKSGVLLDTYNNLDSLNARLKDYIVNGRLFSSEVVPGSPFTTVFYSSPSRWPQYQYTYHGDANADGIVNADDYFFIDFFFLQPPPNPLYAEGDFNYDGRINADDYFLIDSAFLASSAPSESLVRTAVPTSATSTLTTRIQPTRLARQHTGARTTKARRSARH